MEAQETAELIEQSAHGDKSQNRLAPTSSILAMVLAIASLRGAALGAMGSLSTVNGYFLFF